MAEPGLSAEDLAGLIAGLERALYSGQRKFTYSDSEGQSVSHEYNSVAELEAALDRARARYAELTGAGTGGLQISIAGFGRA